MHGMTKTPIRDESLPGWTFWAEENSNGVYEIRGRHTDGRSVSRIGTDFDALVVECKVDARDLLGKRDA
jgi:hypothetical protein